MILRRILGALVLAAALLPGHRLLAPERTGLSGAATRSAAEALWASGLVGALLVVVSAALLARVWRPRPLARRLGGMTAALTRVPGGWWAAAMGGCALLLSGAAALLLFGGQPTSVDEMVQLLHARALLAGRAALELPGPPAAWLVQNGVLVEAGWASVYPPGHTVALAAGLAAGAGWLVGPLAAGVTAALTALSLDRLLDRDPGPARWAALLVALSPFLLLLGGTRLSHTTAAALVALVLWSALRARDGHPAWGLLVGAAVGALVVTRPWTGLVLGTVLPLAVWLGPAARRGGARGAARFLLARGAGVVVGGLPFAAALLSWNAHLFGHPLTLGYTAAFGPAHGLGFHPDPWGNAYGPVEAVAYTGADLLLLGTHLLETPLSALLAVGAALLLVPRLLPGAGVLLAWAGAAVAANALYWHHGMHLGPRLLYESAPAWAALTAVSVAALHRWERPPGGWKGGVLWAVLLSGLGAAALLPGRVASAAAATRAAATVAPPPSPPAPALVFVHGSWSSRVSARLAAAGMRRDSIETALRRNDLCRVHRWADARTRGAPPPLELELEPLPGTPRSLRSVELSPGNRALRDPDAAPTEGCAREARADAVAGTTELAPLLWRAPPLPGARTLLARDLGPEENRAVLEAHPERTPWLLLGDGTLLPWTEAAARVWGVTDGG